MKEGADKRLLVRHNNGTRNSLLFPFLYSIGTLLIPLGGGGGGWTDAQCNSLAAQHRSSLLLLMFLSSLLSFSSCSPASRPTLLSFFLSFYSVFSSSSSSSFTFETMELCSAVLLPKKKISHVVVFSSIPRGEEKFLFFFFSFSFLCVCVCLFTPRTRVMNGGELSDATIDHFFWHQATLLLLLLLLLPFPAPLINIF